ncbi:PWI domain-containing protein [Hirsutella rhossiliensis]|uniref:PWI domain-containing protein n=1 Tax=Hirsutella rhossiliensis TaxID=111463 RepID=A0A9P8N441_9HYPO|nr:PWI domain-containing protein [Hirsutella rhossiliensis]KAH0965474.1 PWI domain-containing protein [Hirsutella rhossiliensis]
MLFPEGDAPPLKAWIVKRIENTSDADSDVLAEYVIALLKHDGDQPAIRKLCEQEIPDFLTEDPKAFLDDVFEAIKHRSYIPGGAPPEEPSPEPDSQSAQAHAGSRKRAFGDEADSLDDGQRDQSYGDHRSVKQPRRGARRGPEDNRGSKQGGFGSMNLPAPPAGMPQFDVNNPMEAFMQMQAMGMPFAGLQGYPQLNFGGRPQRHQPKRKGRCRDFDTKGFCSRGSTCIYDHGNESIYVPPSASNGEEYDPNDAVMQMPTMPHQGNPLLYASDGPRGRGGRKSRGNVHRGGRRGGGRALFSADGPVHDRTKSTIVVENIPEECFSEDQVCGFFSQFGNIVEVSMQPYKHLAVVKYDKWAAANDAYRSPKVIFDNRFVKVFWYKEETDNTLNDVTNNLQFNADAGPAVRGPEPEVDLEDLNRRQEEAQRQHRERQAKREELERQRQELEKKQQDLLAKHQAETEQLRARLTEKNGSDAGSGTSATELLRAQLAALEQEAKILGLDPSAAEDGGAPGFRGGYRGRGAHRGRGAPRGRGIHRGQGARHAAYAQYSIDNRPRKLAVHGVDFTPPDKDEVLRHFLLNLGEFESVETTPSVTHVSFQDRKTAEKFYYSLHGKELPGVEGRLDLAWVNAGAAAAAAKKPVDGSTPALSDDDEGPSKDETAPTEMQQRQVDMDYEVGDDDAWDDGVR